MSTIALTSRRSRLRSAALTLVVTIGAILMLAPFYWMFIASTYPSKDVFTSPPHLLPGPYWLENLQSLFSTTGFGRSLLNSFIISSLYTVIGGLVCVMAGYAFAKFDFRGKNLLFGALLVALALPSQVTLVPLFQIMVGLDWLNTIQALLLPNLALPFGIFLMRQTIQAVPDELLQAARIDGAGEWRTFWGVVLPTLRPSLAALGIFMFLQQWNDFVYPLVVLRTQEAYTVPVALATLQGLQSTDYGQLMMGTTLSVLPVLGVFLILQRQFVAGILSGAVKQ